MPFPRVPRLSAAAAMLAIGLVVSGCSNPVAPPDESDRPDPPKAGVCRALSAEAVAEATDASDAVPCAEPHTSQTFAVGTFPKEYAKTAWSDRALGQWIYATCGSAFVKFLGADESRAARTLLSWAWFRPSEDAWADGARWYRCDVVGGPEGATEFRPLPKDAKGMLGAKPPQQWMLCARGEQFAGSPKVPCAEKHDWRAVTTVKVSTDPIGDAVRAAKAAKRAKRLKKQGKPVPVISQTLGKYPGDRAVQAIARNTCGDSVMAYLDYPLQDFDFAVTVFHQADWELGNNRAICWARTPK